MSITLHIETLVLDGLELSRAQAERLRLTLTAELTSLLSAGELQPVLQASQARLEAPALALHASGAPELLGAQLAGSVFASLEASPSPAASATSAPGVLR